MSTADAHCDNDRRALPWVPILGASEPRAAERGDDATSYDMMCVALLEYRNDDLQGTRRYPSIGK